MTGTVRRIWDILGDLSEAADYLGETEASLRRLRDAGRIPDPRHDARLLRLARDKGRRLRGPDIVKARTGPANKAERVKAIKALVAAAGGVKQFAERVGTSASAIYCYQCRGWIAMSRRYEVRRLAEELGVPIHDSIFTRP